MCFMIGRQQLHREHRKQVKKFFAVFLFVSIIQRDKNANRRKRKAIFALKSRFFFVDPVLQNLLFSLNCQVYSFGWIWGSAAQGGSSDFFEPGFPWQKHEQKGFFFASYGVLRVMWFSPRLLQGSRTSSPHLGPHPCVPRVGFLVFRPGRPPCPEDPHLSSSTCGD